MLNRALVAVTLLAGGAAASTLIAGTAFAQAAPAPAAAPATEAAATPAAPAGPIVGNAEAAKNKISMCIGCHEIPGYKASFPTVYPVPKLYGQNAKYISNALEAYRKGDRSHPTMRGVAGSLSDQDIADLAAYYSGGSTQTAAK